MLLFLSSNEFGPILTSFLLDVFIGCNYCFIYLTDLDFSSYCLAEATDLFKSC